MGGSIQSKHFIGMFLDIRGFYDAVVWSTVVDTGLLLHFPPLLLELELQIYGGPRFLSAENSVSPEGTCAYGLSANRSSIFVTGAPGSGKTRSCAFMGILVACLTGKLTLYTTHGNESARTYIEAADRLTAGSHSFVRSRIARIPASKKKETHKLPFDAHDAPTYGRRWTL